MGPLSPLYNVPHVNWFQTASVAAITAVLSLLEKTPPVSEVACDCPVGNTGGGEWGPCPFHLQGE